MRLHCANRLVRWITVVTVAAALLPQAWAGHPKTPEKSEVVDSGSFGVFVDGKRVATESFQVQQRTDLSIATSEFKLEDGSKIGQRAELQLTPSGDLRHYEWHELSPGKAQAVVQPGAEFLMEYVTPNPPAKPAEQPFVLPVSTMVLDDYVFSHREILIWRYLAQTCKGKLADCKPEKLQFGVLVPVQRTALLVTLEYAGVEKVTIRGAQQDLSRINLTSDAGNWVLWLDANLRLMRIVIPDEKTEVLRD